MSLSITLVRVEGPNHQCHRAVEVSSWIEANSKLSSWSWSAPTKGYDKVDFEITADGEVIYRGRYDLTSWTYGVPDLSKQVLDRLERLATNTSLAMPDRVTAQLILNRARKEL